MSCQEWRDEIALLVGGELTPPDQTAVEEHLERCTACRELAAELRTDRRALADLAAEPPPPEALSRVRSRVGEGLRREAREAGGPGRGAWLALAATILAAAIGLGIWTLELRTGPRSPHPGTAPGDELPSARAEARSGSTGGARSGRAEGLAEAEPKIPAASTEGSESSPGPAPTGSEDRLAAAVPRDGLPGPASERTEPGEPSVPSTSGEPITIRIVSEDPDIVFYWLTDEPKEIPDETTV